MPDDLSDLERAIGVRFKNRGLLRQALVHTSYVNENPGLDLGSNERLEFLGDAVLGLVIGKLLYQDFPDVDEGRLTELRAHLVRRDTLARAAARLRLGEYLRLGRGEEAAGGRDRPTNLAHAFEALVGAVYLDQGLDTVERFVHEALGPELATVRERRVPADPKSQLQEYVQSHWQITPTYRTVRIEGPDHARRFTVEVSVGGEVLGAGEGRSKQQAEKAAARVALEALERKEASAGQKSE
ncbi:MAG TPA: ribonuclease III [Dehalococcoidia bacterium]|nr:ribonuclease III [Dehalococcoidia bacterium]